MGRVKKQTKENNDQPLILVFYLDREMMANQEVMEIVIKQVEDTIEYKKLNILAFFLPTDDKERIECINPIQVEETEMSRINKIIEDLTKNFDIGQGADENIDLDNE